VGSEGNDFKYYVFNEELFNIINDTHLPIGHGGRNRMGYGLNKKYKNITYKRIDYVIFKFMHILSKERQYCKERSCCKTNNLK